MNVFLRLGFSFLLLLCALVSAQGPECGAGCHHGFCEQPGECRETLVCVLILFSSLRGSSVFFKTLLEKLYLRGDRRRRTRLCLFSWTHSGGLPEERPVFGAQNGGSCVNSSCLCPAGFSGPSCELHTGRLRHKPRAKASGPAHAFHKLLLRPAGADPLVTRSQVICFAVLGLLTCLVILVTTGIVFFNRCETWMANAKYSQLVRELRASDRERQALNIVLPEKIKLSSYGQRYTSI
ncbi:protein delta homolog 1 isoform X2 [Puntigrus tetrazona]|uniref:protein delta homolog 1 isoform X2 n=1 Tax=Puntigrus tetrazona TaxID=1606681 RepID=UPI001C8AFB98|nr:protein delta homolog 1 isoform X2 [Puntigrus tetrazona]